MNRHDQSAIKALGDRWDELKGFFGLLGMPNPRPDDRNLIFQLSNQAKTDGIIAIDVAPVVFNLPERANGNVDLFVHVRGRLFLDEEEFVQNRALRTKSFGTEVAYFRQCGNQLLHVYGAHYDFDNTTVGHPAFHAQMQSYVERSADIAEVYEMECTSTDGIHGVLNRVRVPSAQMDFFSFVLQLCADHLIDAHSGDEQKAAFRELRDVGTGIKGSAFLARGLPKDGSNQCLRAHHWY